ncbi:MAG: lysylphosphatidylglycerol synthase domain-containing protein [Pseudomonadota bacterium]
MWWPEMALPETVKRVLPWVGSGVLVAYMAMTTDLMGVADALESVDAVLLGLLLVIGTLIAFFTDTIGVAMGFSAFVAPVTFREAIPIKATSYFLNVLNYNAALAGMAFYLNRSRNVGFWRALGALMFVNVVDLLGVLLLLSLGMVITLGTETFSPGLGFTLRAIAWGGLAGFVAGALWFRSDLPLPVFGRLRTKALFLPIREASLGTWSRLLAARLLLQGQYLLVAYALLVLFGVEVPFQRLLAYVPVLTFIQIVPISISGIGTTQIAARQFYGPYVVAAGRSPLAVVDACTTTGIVGFLLLRVILAYFFLGELSRDIIRKGADVPEEPAS